MTNSLLDDRSPAQKGFDFYGEDLFYKVLDLHLMFGYVHATPDYFVMARPVPKSITYDDMIDITKVYNSSECDSWCIYFYAGNMQKVFENLPFSLPYIVFERKGSTKIYLLEKLKQRISKTYGFQAKDAPSTASTPTATISGSDNSRIRQRSAENTTETVGPERHTVHSNSWGEPSA
jgi:hypothetical protein